MHAEVLEKLHEIYQDLACTQEYTEYAVWWPDLSQDFQTMSDSCTICKMHNEAQNR